MRKLLAAAAKPLLLLSGLVVAALLLRWLGADPRTAADAAASRGSLPFVALGAVACAVAVPRQIVAMAAGYAFGLWPGTALALVAEILGCGIDFAWARLLARRAALRFLARRAPGRLHRLDRYLTEQAFTTTLTLRLLPFGSNVLLNLAAGVSGAAAAPFLLASLIGYVPQTVVFALAGTGANLSSGARLALAAALLLVSVGLGLVLLRRRRMLV